MSRIKGSFVPETNRRILMSALRKFGEHGFGNTTIEEICADAGVSRQTVYTYYRDKDDVFESLLRLEGEIYAEKIKDIDPNESPVTILNKIFFLMFDHFQERFRFLMTEVTVNEQIKVPAIAKIVSTRCLELVQHALVKGAAIGEFRAGVDPQQYLATANLVVNGYYSSAGAVDQILGMKIQEGEAVNLWREHLSSMLIASIAAK